MVALYESQVTLEERKFKEEIRLKEAELALRRDEISAQLERDKRPRWSPLVTTLLIGVIGLIGTGLGILMQGRASVDLEKQRLQSSLILSAIETGDAREAAKNLRFLLEAGLIEDEAGSMAALLKKPETVPVLPASSRRDGASSGPSPLP